MAYFRLEKQNVGLLIVDVQEKVLNAMSRGQEVLHTIIKVVKGAQILELPIVITEQYPQGLGTTVLSLKNVLGEQYKPLFKQTFSCLDDFSIKEILQKMHVEQWIVIGIEAHVCVLQTAVDLLQMGKQVAILNDATTSRSFHDLETALAEMREAGARITSSETILFELVKDSKAPIFKSISQLIKIPAAK